MASVTVVVPVHDKAPYVARALRSVAGQTRAPAEVVVVDDGSTDGGPAEAAVAGAPRTRVLRQARKGPGGARNAGLAAATTEWVAFLDADDEWRPTLLERLTEQAQASPGLVAAFCGLEDARNGRALVGRSCPGGVVDDYFEAVVRSRGFGMSSSSVLVRRQALLDAGGFREDCVRGEDVDAWTRLAWTGPVGYVPETLAVYHRGLPGCLSQVPLSSTAARPPVARSYAEWADRIPAALQASSRRYVAWFLVQHALDLAMAGHRRPAAGCILEGARLGAAPLRLAHAWGRLVVPHAVAPWRAP